ncbi:PstA family ABC transporter permease [Marinobacter persicus]|jgi:phosphate transport system permease protein|uniref:Phosphate transport system permease protein n=1 Tax=Marinobacter persicus TaxID=930118 RepID=A0A2S6GA35_9GAMM|nr:ABC transporter permease subunit [Marinobacter persicus]KXS53220.1 MAG: ABC-type phosphate transport system, permease component [Marinobacter sp. T13-3]PPK53343.1 phosphate transport system permease protein [Marinobacter persicus]PPK56180.1 phosphate transport system permease protein [Marinobacter persicus]PPK59775.1 phosphate transport system permease protein [Marinobacter persicus]
MNRRYVEQYLIETLIRLSAVLVVGVLVLIIGMTLYKGGQVLINQPSVAFTAPGPLYLLGGSGGFLHAILGSFAIVLPATVIATVLAIASGLYLQSDYCSERFARAVNVLLYVLWGTPAIVYGVFVLTLLIMLESRSSLIAATFAVSLLQFPIIARFVDEALKSVSADLKETVYALGTTRFETLRLLLRAALPGVVAGVIMGFARGLGDGAAVLFTAGGGIEMPSGLNDPATTLPILIFQQASSAYPSVREDAYAAAFVLMMLVLVLVAFSKFIARRFSRFAQEDH